MSSYLFDAYIVDKNRNKMTIISQDTVSPTIETSKTPTAVAVDLNQMDVWVTNAASEFVEYKDGESVDKIEIKFGNTVTRFRNGVRQHDIPVGKTPMGICSLPNGAVYVTNYGSNSVSKIVNNRVVKTIYVGMGPRGICGTKDGKIYVSNYLSNTVSVLVNDMVVKDIEVGYNPMGICAGRGNFVWVACAGSNMVCQINNLDKELNIPVGGMPYGICCDFLNRVYVTCYNDGTINKIAGGTVDKVIQVGRGPLGISYNKNNEIYVTNFLDGTVSKVVDDEEKTTISGVFDNPCSFGDFIGGSAFNTFMHFTPTEDVVVSMDNLDPELKSIIEKIKNYDLPIQAVNVSHNVDGSNTENVEEALEALLSRKRQLYFNISEEDLVPGPVRAVFPISFEAEHGITANSVVVRFADISNADTVFKVERESVLKNVTGYDDDDNPIYGAPTRSWVTVGTFTVPAGNIDGEFPINENHEYEKGESIRVNLVNVVAEEVKNINLVLNFNETL